MLNEAGALITSLLPNAIHKRYQMQKYEVNLKKHFLDTFKRENPKMNKLIREWCDEYKSFTIKDSIIYHI